MTGSRTVTQSVTTKPVAGATYMATIWVKPGSTSAVSGALRLTALGGTTETAVISFSDSSGWMKVSVPLTVSRTGHTSLRFDVVLGSGDYRLDSASLVMTEAAATTASSSTAPLAPAKAP